MCRVVNLYFCEVGMRVPAPNEIAIIKPNAIERKMIDFNRAMVELEEEAIETALSCICAGVPVSDVIVQVLEPEYRDFKLTVTTLILFNQKPIEARSKIYEFI